MNYIRTGLTITEVEWNSSEEKWKDVKTPCHFILDEMISGVDYKLGDTPQELCDEFVIVDKRNNVHYIMDYDDVIDEIYNGRIYDEDVIYGAIWTDKGLIYVAKMNEKGELELI